MDAAFDEKRRQWKLVKAFFATFRNPDGSMRRGYNEYATPSKFGRPSSTTYERSSRNGWNRCQAPLTHTHAAYDSFEGGIGALGR